MVEGPTPATIARTQPAPLRPAAPRPRAPEKPAPPEQPVDVTECGAPAPVPTAIPLADRSALEQLIGPPLGALIADFIAPRLALHGCAARLSGVLQSGNIEFTLTANRTEPRLRIEGPSGPVELTASGNDVVVRAPSGEAARFQPTPGATPYESLPGLEQWTPAAWFAVTAGPGPANAIPQPADRPDIPEDAPAGIEGWRLTNENSTKFDIPAARGRAYLGIGSSQNYDHLTAVRADAAYLVDVDAAVTTDHRGLLALVGLSPSPQEFLSLLAGVPLRDGEHDLPPAQLLPLLRQRPRDREYLAATAQQAPDAARVLLIGQDYFLAHWEKQMGEGQHQWLTDPERFAHLRALQTSGRIVVRHGDFTGSQTLAAIGRDLETSHQQLGTIYLSNAEAWFGSRSGTEHGKKGWIANLAALPGADDAVVLRTFEHTKKSNGYEWSYQTAPLAAYRQLATNDQPPPEESAVGAAQQLHDADEQRAAAAHTQWRAILGAHGWSVGDDNKVRAPQGLELQPRTARERQYCLALALGGETGADVCRTVEALSTLAQHGITLPTDAVQTHAELQSRALELKRGLHVAMTVRSTRELHDIAAIYAGRADAMSAPTREAVTALQTLVDAQARFTQAGETTTEVARALTWLWRGTLVAHLPLAAPEPVRDLASLQELAADAPQRLETERLRFEALRDDARNLRQSGVNFDFSPAARAAVPIAGQLVLKGETAPVIFESIDEMRTASHLQQGKDDVGFLEPMRRLYQNGWRFTTSAGDLSAWPGLVWLALRRGQLQLYRPEQQQRYDAAQAWYLLSSRADQPLPLEEKQRERYGLFDGLMKAGVVFKLPGEHGPTRLSAVETLLQPHDVALSAQLPRRMAFNLWRTRQIPVDNDDALRRLAKRMHVAPAEAAAVPAPPQLVKQPGLMVAPAASPAAAPAPEPVPPGPPPASGKLPGEITGTRQQLAKKFMGNRDGTWVDEKSPVMKNSFQWWAANAPESAQRAFASTVSGMLAKFGFSRSIVQVGERAMQALSQGGFDSAAGLAAVMLACYDDVIDDKYASGDFHADTHVLNTDGLAAVQARASGDAAHWLKMVAEIAPSQYFASSRRGVIKIALRAVAEERPFNQQTLGQAIVEMLDICANDDAAGEFHADASKVQNAGLEYCRGMTTDDTKRWLQMAGVMVPAMFYASSGRAVTRAVAEAMRDGLAFNERNLAAMLARALVGCSDANGRDKQWHADSWNLLNAVMPTVDNWMSKAETKPVVAELKKFRAAYGYANSGADAARMCFEAIARGTDAQTMQDMREAFVAAATTGDRKKVAGL